MRLCLTVVFLMVLAWTTADPIPTASHDASEACRSFDPISDTSVILGQLYFEAGFANNTFTQSLLGNTSSVWAKVIKTEDGFHLTEYKKMNGKCVGIQFNATIDGDAATAHILGMETHIELRNFSKTAILMDMKASTSNIKSVIQKFNSDLHDHNDQAHDDHAHEDHAHDNHAHKEDVSLHIHHLFLIGRKHEVTKIDLEHFKEYVKCTDFSEDPDFHFKSDQEYCSEDGSTLIQ